MFWTVILYIISIYFCLMLPVRIIAALRKPTSVYADQPEQQNPMEGKKVAFVADENDKANADGVRGHLEAVGIASHTASFYEKYIKRGLDILISFGGLIVLSPLLACLSLAIYIDDPGPVLFCQKRLGKNKQYFSLHKFRSMKMITPHDVPTHMLENPEQYITKVGKYLKSDSVHQILSFTYYFKRIRKARYVYQ